MAYEGLNNLGHSGSRVIVILNDNGRRYAPTVSRLSESLTRLRLHPGVSSARRRIESARAGASPGAAALPIRACRVFIPPSEKSSSHRRFSRRWACAMSGPSTATTSPVWSRLSAKPPPSTAPSSCMSSLKKGRGYKPAEDDEEKCLHDAGSFDPATGPTESSRALTGYTLAFSECDARNWRDARRRRRDNGRHARALPACCLSSSAGPDRFFDVGIAEQAAVTSAAGMAMGGLRPVVAVYSTFLSRAFDQANLDVGLHGLPVVFALDRAGHHR